MKHVLLLTLLLLAVPASTHAEDEVAAQAVLGLLAPRRGETIADMGCGSGVWTFKLASAVGPRGRILAVDIDPEAVATVRRRAADEDVTNVEVIQSVPDDPRLPEGKLDAIFMNNVIDWVERRALAGFLAGVRGALKPDGRLIIRDPSGGPDRVIAELYRAGFALVEAKIPLETASDRSFSTGWYALKLRPAEIQPALFPRLGLPERHRTRLHLAEELFRMGLLRPRGPASRLGAHPGHARRVARRPGGSPGPPHGSPVAGRGDRGGSRGAARTNGERGALASGRPGSKKFDGEAASVRNPHTLRGP